MLRSLDRVSTPRRATVVAYVQVAFGAVFVLQGSLALLTERKLLSPILGIVALGAIVGVLGIVLYRDPARMANGQEPATRRHYLMAALVTYGLLFALGWTALTLA